MKFEWDEHKRLINICKHGIDFLDVESIFENDTVIIEDNRFDYKMKGKRVIPFPPKCCNRVKIKRQLLIKPL